MPDTDRHTAKAPFWTREKDSVLDELGCGAEGLTADEANRRLDRYGPNADKPTRRAGIAIAFSRRLGSMQGQVIVFFVMAVAAAEAVIGLAIVISVFRHRQTLDPQEMQLLKW